MRPFPCGSEVRTGRGRRRNAAQHHRSLQDAPTLTLCRAGGTNGASAWMRRSSPRAQGRGSEMQFDFGCRRPLIHPCTSAAPALPAPAALVHPCTSAVLALPALHGTNTSLYVAKRNARMAGPFGRLVAETTLTTWQRRAVSTRKQCGLIRNRRKPA